MKNYIFKKTLIGYVLYIRERNVNISSRKISIRIRKANKSESDQFLKYFEKLKNDELEYDNLLNELEISNDSNHGIDACNFKHQLIKFKQHFLFRSLFLLQIKLNYRDLRTHWWNISEKEYINFNAYLSLLDYKSFHLSNMKENKPEFFI